jgi:hypothetical protein
MSNVDWGIAPTPQGRKVNCLKWDPRGKTFQRALFIARAAVGAQWTAQTTQSVLKVIY